MSKLVPHEENLTARYAERAALMVPSEIRSLFAVASRPEIVSLAGGMPNLSALPMEMMADVVKKLILENGQEALQYGSGQGHPRLREQICEMMALEGIRAKSDDVVITTGSQAALDLITRIFIDPGDVILVEAPSYVGALGVFAQYQSQVIHVAMDDKGLIPAALTEAINKVRAAGGKIKFLYCIPNFQNPSGVTMPASRRSEILDICRESEIFVVEDNPYGLLNFDESVPNAMRAEDHENVIYLGSFSKTIVPGLRVGWALVPQGIKEKLIIANESSVLCPSNFAQLTISSYLAHEPWRDQIASFCALYKERRDAMLETLDAHFPASATWTKPKGGFYVWVTLPPEIDTKLLVPKAIAAKVAYVPGAAFYADGFGSWQMRLSYCHPTPERIRKGVAALGNVIKEEISRRGGSLNSDGTASAKALKN
jgi:DNA-binding transcriptional MocR family regulator